MKKVLSNSLNWLVLIVLTSSFLFSCTLDAASTAASQRQITSRVAAIIDEEIEFLIPHIQDDLPQIKASLDGITGEMVVRNAINEKSEKYLNFCFEVDRARSVDDVINATVGLIGDDDLKELKEHAAEIENRLYEEGEIIARAMTLAQQKALFKDLKKLAVKATVLFAAGIVYACMPTTVFWGKVSAACAVSVAAGVVASGFMSFMEYKKFGSGSDSFATWIEEITKEPYAAWALASAMIATGGTMKRTPVLTGIVIAVFAIYDIAETMKPLLKKYNFSFWLFFEHHFLGSSSVNLHDKLLE